MSEIFSESVVIKSSSGKDRIRIHADSAGTIGPETTVFIDARYGNIQLGGDGSDGDLLLNNRSGQRTIHLSADQALAQFGGRGTDGRAQFFRKEETNPNKDTKATIYINGDRGNIRLGGNGVDGRMAFFTDDVTGNNLYNYGQATIELDGRTGDILLRNADCAEEFDVINVDDAEPGTVMVLSDDGSLTQSIDAYDTRVAGVVSGAGHYRPGIVLDSKKNPSAKRVPVALLGKVFCKVDAQYGAVQVGDLLTTSPTAGHAMKLTDVHRAFGSVIGKAMQPLAEGSGLIPILIALQ